MDTAVERTKRWAVVVDDRERDSGIREALQSDPELQVLSKRLALGDFVVDGRLIVERKTVLDFALSVVDGRLFSQSRRLAGCGLFPLLVLEGPASMTAGCDISREALQGAMVTVQLIFGLPVLRSASPSETVWLLKAAARQTALQDAGSVHRPGYHPRSRRGRQSFLLQGLPGTGPVLALRLLEHFGSVQGVMTASQDELVCVEGIGNSRAAAIREAVREAGTPYKNNVLTYNDNEI